MVKYFTISDGIIVTLLKFCFYPIPPNEKVKKSTHKVVLSRSVREAVRTFPPESNQGKKSEKILWFAVLLAVSSGSMVIHIIALM